jgi:hypothetical protein
MNKRRWLSVILMMGLILALSTLCAQAEPYWAYRHHRGHAYGWDGPGPHHYGRHYKHSRGSCGGPHNRYVVERVYERPPAVAYVAPVAPVMGIPYPQPQPYYSQPQQYGPLGFHGQINYGF